MHSDKFINQSVANGRGSVNPYVNWKDLSCITFDLPPQEMQDELSILLWNIEAVIERNKTLLSQVLNNVKVFREKVLCAKKFKRVPLGTLLNKITAGKSLNGINEPIKSSSEYAVIKVSAVGENGFVPEENKRLIDQDSFIHKFKVSINDLLITRANTTELVGRTCVVEENFPNLMLSDKSLKLELDEKKANPFYINQVLKSFNSRLQIESVATGTGGAMKNIAQSEIRALKIPSPSIDEQNAFEKRIKEFRRVELDTRSKIKQSIALKRAIINKVF
jgi:type I restriction enzyme S subunit